MANKSYLNKNEIDNILQDNQNEKLEYERADA